LEEQAKRQRLEERCKSVREYSEKIKERNGELEAMSTNQDKQIQDLQSKLSKYKKDCKSSGALVCFIRFLAFGLPHARCCDIVAAEVAIQKRVVSEKEEQLAKIKLKGDKSSSTMKQVTSYVNVR
jgi:uncharacterized coiled-coil protein SlyX